MKKTYIVEYWDGFLAVEDGATAAEIYVVAQEQRAVPRFNRIRAATSEEIANSMTERDRSHNTVD